MSSGWEELLKVLVVVRDETFDPGNADDLEGDSGTQNSNYPES